MTRDDDLVLRIISDADASGPPAAPDADAAVRDPARALRVATTVRGVLDELRGSEPGEAVRDRLASLHDRTLEQLEDLMSDELLAELREVALADTSGVSAPELRVVLAELVGWLEGLFHGLSSSLVDADDDVEPPSRSGNYL
ncbi:MAG: bacterial proteasome activator family protein [Actinobacteria bacterium]|nr:bacterial proteasome activator family protein [Actinomycetota bacterium]